MTDWSVPIQPTADECYRSLVKLREQTLQALITLGYTPALRKTMQVGSRTVETIEDADGVALATISQDWDIDTGWSARLEWVVKGPKPPAPEQVAATKARIDAFMAAIARLEAEHGVELTTDWDGCYLYEIDGVTYDASGRVHPC